MTNFSQKLSNIFELLDEFHYLLLKEKCVKDVYCVEQHKNSIKTIERYSNFSLIDWQTIKNNLIASIQCISSIYAANTKYDFSIETDIIDVSCELADKHSLELHNLDCIKNEQLGELVFKCSILATLFCVSARKEGFIDEVIDSNLKPLLKKEDRWFYRGEENYDEFKLIPSMLRKKTFSEVVVVDKEFIKSEYKKTGCLDRYEKVFGTSRLSYKMLCFMQHYGCTSPFLDFSESHLVSLSFATNNKKGVDSTLYVFKKTDSIRDKFNVNDISIVIASRRLSMLDVIRGKDLVYCSFIDFDVRITVYSDKTNDRMKYQKGVFLLINQCVIVNDVMLMPLTSDFLKKYRIPYSRSDGLTCLKIKRKISMYYPQYKLPNLLNPGFYLKKK